MKGFIIELIKIALWFLAFPFMLIYALLKNRKLITTILCIVFFPIAIVIAVLYYAVKD